MAIKQKSQMSYEQIVHREGQIWEDRVFYPNERFKPDTKANVKKLVNYATDYREKFILISASSEASVYKIGRLLVESGIKNQNIFFEDESISSYIDSTAPKWRAKTLLQEMISTIKRGNQNKFLIIPSLDCEWTLDLALYFIREIKNAGIVGLIFHSDPNMSNTLAQFLCQETSMDMLQFPEENFERPPKKLIKTDEY